MRRELADTLIELVRAVTPPPDTGLVVTEALLDVPLEVQPVTDRGRLVFLGDVPHSRWKSGFLPQTHLTRITVTLVEEPNGG